MKIGRNEPCPCGSGKKYKRCCLRKPDEKAAEPEPEHAHGVELEDFPDEWEMEALIAPYRDIPRPPEGKEYAAEDLEQIEAWWEGHQNLLESDKEAFLKATINLLDTNPKLFPYLDFAEIHWEMFLEIDGQKDWTLLCETLRKFKTSFLEAYLPDFPYYDRYLLFEAVFKGDEEEVAELSSRHKIYADYNPDFASSLINLLLLTGMEKPLFDLVEAIGLPCWYSDNVMSGYFAVDWLIFQHYLPALENRLAPDVAVEDVSRRLSETGLDRHFHVEVGFLRNFFNGVRVGPDILKPEKIRKKKEFQDFIRQLSFHFCGYLAWERNLHWSTAKACCDKVYHYLLDGSKKKKTKFDYLPSKPDLLERYLVEKCSDMGLLDPVRALLMLQSVYFFADYLAYRQIIDEGRKQDTQNMCFSLAEKAKQATSNEIESLLFARFPSVPAERVG